MRWLETFVTASCLILLFHSEALAQGIVLPGVGAVNRSMAGATVAAPIDAAGAMHWNPAAITGLERSEVMFGAEFLYPRTKLTSALPANSFGPGIPPVPLAGTASSNSGIAVLPTSALVTHSRDSCWTYGFGVYTIGGFGANYAASAVNPILTPQPPDGVGVGAAFSKVAIIQMAPTAAVRITDQISLGFAPTINVADLAIDPGFFASPEDTNGDGFDSYPSATHARLHWGLGFQVGIYMETDTAWSFGASFKSPQWFEEFHFNSQDELGLPRQLSLNIDYPMIVSVGAAYRGVDGLLVALDVRYIDYDNTDGLGGPARFDATGAAEGLGWQSVVSVALGAQYEVNECLSLRLGYLYNQNPIRNSDAFFNVVSSAIYQHAIFAGATRHLNESIGLSIAYLHAFRNSITGPYMMPAGPIAGSFVSSSQETDSLIASFSVYF